MSSLVSSDIGYFFSAGGGPGSLRYNNLGGTISATQITSSTMRNFCIDLPRSLLGNIGGTAGTWAVYFPYYIKNKHLTDTVKNLYQWVYKPSSHPSLSVAIGFDPAGINGTAQTIATQQTKPFNVTFSAININTTGNLFIDFLAPGEYQPCWVQVSGQNGISSIPMATFGIKVKWDPVLVT